MIHNQTAIVQPLQERNCILSSSCINVNLLIITPTSHTTKQPCTRTGEVSGPDVFQWGQIQKDRIGKRLQSFITLWLDMVLNKKEAKKCLCGSKPKDKDTFFTKTHNEQSK